jgi:hypothetical protein
VLQDCANEPKGDLLRGSELHKDVGEEAIAADGD